MNKKPLLSFCIPTYNRAKRVLQCVEHILQFPGEEIEVVVSNNASTDNTLELLSNIQDKRLKIYTNDENIGVFNWPLVVSRASGSFAALMSDEDIVILENIPYFLALLDSDSIADIGAILYTFEPINKFPTNYVSKSIREGYKLATKYGGHITCHILNMSFFRLRPLADYESTQIDHPRSEAQFAVLLDVAQERNIMLCALPLCRYGIPELSDDKLNIILHHPLLGGWAPQNRVCGFRGQVNTIAQRFGSTNDDCSFILHAENLKNFSVLVSDFLAMLLTYCNTKNDNENYFWNELRNRFQYTYKEAGCVLSQYIDDACNYLATKTTHSIWHDYAHTFSAAFVGRGFDPLPCDLSFTQQVLLGDVLFATCFLLYRSYSEDPNCASTVPLNDEDDIFEIKKTSAMIALINKKDYDAVISFPDVTTVRADYLRGCACLFNSDFVWAEQFFLQFLNRISAPVCVKDIVTGAVSVQYSYYYLGYIYQQCGDIDKALDYFAKCRQLTDGLMLGENLHPKGLGLPHR